MTTQVTRSDFVIPSFGIRLLLCSFPSAAESINLREDVLKVSRNNTRNRQMANQLYIDLSSYSWSTVPCALGDVPDRTARFTSVSPRTSIESQSPSGSIYRNLSDSTEQNLERTTRSTSVSPRTSIEPQYSSRLIGLSMSDSSGQTQTMKPLAASKVAEQPKFCFLNLPREIRTLMYIELFSTQTLESFRKEKCIRTSVCTSFRPVRGKHSSYGLLLANRQCFYEGIKYYYQHSTVLHVTNIGDWECKVDSALHSHGEQQRLMPSRHPTLTPQISLAGCTTSNAQLIKEYTRKVVVYSVSLSIEKLTYFKSLRDVLIKMPCKEWSHWPELQEIVRSNTRPSDEQLMFYHEGVVPEYRFSGVYNFTKGLRRRTHLGSQDTMEEELVSFMDSMPRTRFRARIPVSYKCHSLEISEVSTSLPLVSHFK